MSPRAVHPDTKNTENFQMKATHLLLRGHKHILVSYVMVGTDDPTIRRWKQNYLIHYIKAMKVFFGFIHICY